LAAHTAKERQDWMKAISESTVRSGSAGASSSKGGTPVASSHKRYSSLEHTPVPVSKPGETEGSASPPEIPLLPMSAVTRAAAAEASLQVAILNFCCASLIWCSCVLGQGCWLYRVAGRLGFHVTHGQPVQGHDKFAAYCFELTYCLYSLCCCQAVAVS